MTQNTDYGQSKIVPLFGDRGIPGNHRVLIVDDQPAYRNIMRNMLTGDRGFEIIGEAEDGGSAVERAAVLEPDVIVMDMQMPDMNGIEAARRILSEKPEVRIVLTSMGDDAEYAPLSKEIGACGFVTKRQLNASTVHALVDGRTPPADTEALAA
jgi:DNA-binding NarL/FixJ family response regulator